MIKLKKHEVMRWDSPCLATPRERAAIDRLLAERPELGPVKIFERHGPADGQFQGLTKLMRRRMHGTAFGFIVCTLEWIVAEERRCRHARLAREARDAECAIGAMI